jgi:Phytanoyl-CoA dioxygenase (PhyH)
VDELADSSAYRSDGAELQRRLARDGYVFVRGLLPAGDVRAAYAGVLTALHRGGWVDRQGRPASPMGVVNFSEALADPAFRQAITSRAFNRLAYLGPLRALVRELLGPVSFPYPVKVLRTVYPERGTEATRGRYVHQDYGVAGVQDMLTTWLPLMDVPLAAGLAVRPGSQLGPPRRPHLLGPAERGWASADYRPGDVLVFHCLTSHAALANRSRALRVSGDFRWQRADQPAPAQMVLGPAGGPGELFSRMFAREAWWQPVPSGLELLPPGYRAGPPGPSRFFPVHPRWRYWHPPAGRVH